MLKKLFLIALSLTFFSCGGSSSGGGGASDSSDDTGGPGTGSISGTVTDSSSGSGISDLPLQIIRAVPPQLEMVMGSIAL